MPKLRGLTQMVHRDVSVPYPRSGQGGGYPGYPPPHSIRQSSIASTCYPAGGMPLAFTQENFLVILYFTVSTV